VLVIDEPASTLIPRPPTLVADLLETTARHATLLITHRLADFTPSTKWSCSMVAVRWSAARTLSWWRWVDGTPACAPAKRKAPRHHELAQILPVRLYVRDSLWALRFGVPTRRCARLSGCLDRAGHARLTPAPYSPSTASAVLAAIVGATAALTGFVVTVTTLVVQWPRARFSARYMRLWYRDRMLKVLLGLLVARSPSRSR